MTRPHLADGRPAADAAGGGGARAGRHGLRGHARDASSALTFVATLLGALLIQIGTNLSNDYSDARRGADTEDRLGPVRVTAGGLVPPKQVLIATYVAFGLAVLVGVYLIVTAGWQMLLIGVASILAGVLYTGGPRPYGYEGLGEVFVFLFFGARRGDRHVLRPARGVQLGVVRARGAGRAARDRDPDGQQHARPRDRPPGGQEDARGAARDDRARIGYALLVYVASSPRRWRGCSAAST